MSHQQGWWGCLSHPGCVVQDVTTNAGSELSPTRPAGLFNGLEPPRPKSPSLTPPPSRILLPTPRLPLLWVPPAAMPHGDTWEVSARVSV